MAGSVPYIAFSENGGTTDSIYFVGDPSLGFIRVNADNYLGTSPVLWKTKPGSPDFTSYSPAPFYSIVAGGIFFVISSTQLQTLSGNNPTGSSAFGSMLLRLANAIKTLGGDHQMFPYTPPVIQIPTPVTISPDQVGGVGGGFNKNNLPKFGDYTNEALPRLLQLRWMNNRDGNWNNPKMVSMGKLGELTITREIRNLGVYRTRMYEIVVDGPFLYNICEIEEGNEVLGD
jgi:hypothetical protein